MQVVKWKWKTAQTRKGGSDDDDGNFDSQLSLPLLV